MSKVVLTLLVVFKNRILCLLTVFIVKIAIHHNKKIAALLELKTETDFVSGNNEFQQLGTELAMQIASVPAENVEEFMKQESIRDSSKTIDSMIKDAILKFGENIKIARFIRWELGQ